MNSLLDNLNGWADHALRFAWPMLWQSSLLIGVLFALDLVLRKRLRAAVRYALWLVVLVKLLLPPSLAFPTGPSWWLRPATVAPAKPRPTPVVVTYSADDQPALPSAVTPVLVTPSRPRLSPAAWTFTGMVSVSLGLLAWMLVRWYQVACDARRAAAAPAWLGELLPERQRPARLRLTDRPQSPAVCGLFRPVILLPRSLADRLPPAQLRAVLLHELVHLRRGDVWVNCLQALVQILYWWHPLLWLANARIRRVREEAVDDAAMLALKEEAETYAPTLLEVAKLSLHRPLASLGLVGILESRSSLRQRIERLLDFRPPRRAGLTLGSAVAVLGFAALAVPMGEAPAPLHEVRNDRNGPLSLSLSPSEGERVPRAGEGLVHAPGAWQEALAAAQSSPSAASPLTTPNLIPDGPPTAGLPGNQQPLYTRTFWINQSSLLEGLHVPMGPVGTNDWPPVTQPLFDYLVQAGVDLDPHRNPGKAIFYSYGNQVLLVRATLRDLDIVEQKLAALGALHKQNAEVNTLVRDGVVNLSNSPVLKLLEKEMTIHLDNVPLNSLLINLSTNAGLNIVADKSLPALTNRLSLKLDKVKLVEFFRYLAWTYDLQFQVGDELVWVVDAKNTKRMGEAPPPTSSPSLKILEKEMTIHLDNVPLDTMLIILSTNAGVKIVADKSLPALTNRLSVNMDKVKLGEFFRYVGRTYDVQFQIGDELVWVVDAKSPKGTVRTSDGETAPVIAAGSHERPRAIDQAKPIAKRWREELDRQSPSPTPGVNTVPPQINIKCKFVEVSQDDTQALGLDWYLGRGLVNNGVPTSANPLGDSNAATVNLTDRQFRALLKALQQRSGAELLAEPEITISSGRQAQMKTTTTQRVVTGINERALTAPGITSTNDHESAAYVTEPIEWGVVIDALPTVMEDGYTINLRLVATVHEFLGYDDTRTNRVAVYVNGKQKGVNPPRPKVQTREVQTREMPSTVNVRDGQTVVLGGLRSENVTTIKDEVPMLGDLPLVGRFFRSESKTTWKKNLLIFVTPTIIDPAGNRVHAPDETPLPHGGAPQQPAR